MTTQRLNLLARPTDAQFLAGDYSFARPANALAFKGATNLFTIPGFNGILCKEVASFNEIADLGGGIGYATADGQGVVMYIGRNAEVPRPAAAGADSHYMSAGAAYATPHTDLIGFGGVAVKTETVSAAVDMRARYKSWANNTDTLDFGQITIYERASHGQFNPALFGSGVLFPRIFAVICRAKAGLLYRHKVNHVRGWMVSHVTLGNMRGGMFGCVQKMLETAHSDIRPFIIKAHNKLLAEGAFDYQPQVGVVSYWDGARMADINGTRSGSVTVGMAITEPHVSSIYDSGANSMFGFTNMAPTAALPNVLPNCRVSTFPGFPLDAIQGIAAWHRMAEAGAADGLFNRVDAGSFSAGGWGAYAEPLRYIDQIKTGISNIVSAGIPGDPTMFATFNPSLDSDEPKPELLRIFVGDDNLITGDMLPAYLQKVKQLYKRVESEIKNS